MLCEYHAAALCNLAQQEAFFGGAHGLKFSISLSIPKFYVRGGEISQQSTEQPPRQDGTVEHSQCKVGRK